MASVRRLFVNVCTKNELFNITVVGVTGSEHRVDGKALPLEIHMIFFRTCYLTQEAALKERDGIVALVYLFQVHSSSSQAVKSIIDNLETVKKPFTFVKLNPFALTELIPKFTNDYLAYWGSLSAHKCTHYILWIICRKPSGLTQDQIKSFRTVLGLNAKPNTKNFRPVQPTKKRNIFLVNGSGYRTETLLPID